MPQTQRPPQNVTSLFLSSTPLILMCAVESRGNRAEMGFFSRPWGLGAGLDGDRYSVLHVLPTGPGDLVLSCHTCSQSVNTH